MRRSAAVALVAAIGGAASVAVAIAIDRGEARAPGGEPARATGPVRAAARGQPPEQLAAVTGERAPWQGTDLPPPAPPAPGSAPVERPASEPMPQDIFVARLEAALDLLDETAARVEQELADGEAAGDQEQVRRARVRLGRIAVARERRAGELERARRGELLPP